MTEPVWETYGDPAVCYADLTQCDGAAGDDVAVLLASEDGETWSVVDTSGLDVGDELVGLVGTDDGRLSMAHLVDRGLVVHGWPRGEPLPVGRLPADPERVDLVTVAEGNDPELGVRYHAPLHVHCGMEWLFLGGRPWQRTDGGPDVETGAGDAPT